ncbi:MAG: D-alanyl-D-alanine carboxypeptidase/D-alanyl-D-alanine-endopeptidase [Mycobacteriales bacterium]|nr:D-alanyl-D-alanine carboxypeptidase/D-alanyl-D-alanine-endopeptidase [Mycobacteriales bacterium]
MFRSTGSRVTAALLAIALAGGGGATLVLDGDDPAPVVEALPLLSPRPEPTRTPLLAPAPTGGALPSTAALTRALAPVLADPAVTGRLAVSVVDVETGEALLSLRDTEPVLPASTAKIVTAVAALSALDPAARLTTRVVAGAAAGEVVLVGGGDPLLSTGTGSAYPRPARLRDLVTQLGSTTVTRVLVDDSLYAGPRLGPGWRPTYVTSGDVMPVSSLAVDSGRSLPGRGPRVADPALAAGQALAKALGVKAPVTRGRAAGDAAVLASVVSPTVGQLVEDMLVRSDNDLAESLARQVALAKGQPATFTGAAAAVAAVLEEAGVPRGSLALVDASGLSRDDRVQPAALTAVLRALAVGDASRLGPALTGLPVAGFDGTLAKRYRTGPSLPAAGVVRAKTGTLNGVSALAGLVRTRDGRLLAFDLTADGVPLGATRQAEAALDRFAAVLASCGCR